MIGYRGCYRYVREPDLFQLELEVLARVLEETPNIVLMIPFVRTAWELEACLGVVDTSPVAGALPAWVMAEVPSVAYWIPTYATMGVQGVSIGSNDLTQLMLGVDRDSQICAERRFRRGRPRSARCHRADHRRLPGLGHHVVAVRPGAVEPAGLRRAPRPARHHVDLGQPRRRGGRAQDGGGRRVAHAARGGRARPPGDVGRGAYHQLLGQRLVVRPPIVARGRSRRSPAPGRRPAAQGVDPRLQVLRLQLLPKTLNRSVYSSGKYPSARPWNHRAAGAPRSVRRRSAYRPAAPPEPPGEVVPCQVRCRWPVRW